MMSDWCVRVTPPQQHDCPQKMAGWADECDATALLLLLLLITSCNEHSPHYFKEHALRDAPPVAVRHRVQKGLRQPRAPCALLVDLGNIAVY